MDRLKYILALGLVAIAFGCPVRSFFPLVTEKDRMAVPEIVGIWKTTADGEIDTVRRSGDRIYRSTGRDKHGKLHSYTVQFGRIGKFWFMDSTPEREAGDYHLLRMHVISRFWLDGDTLRISSLDGTWLKKMADSGKIKIAYLDAIEQRQLPPVMQNDDILLAGSTDELQRFVLQYAEDPRAFPPPRESRVRVNRTPARSQTSVNVERLSAAQGLYGNEVHCILQDSRGYLWFGTERGLNRYDGYTFTVFKHEEGNPSSIIDAKVQALWEDEQGTLWAGTWKGLEKFDRATGTFSHFLPEPGATDEWSNVIYDVCEDKKGILWLSGNGLKSFDRSTGKFTFYPHNDTMVNKHVRRGVDAVFEDSEGFVWLGTSGALERFDPSTRSYKQFWLEENLGKDALPDINGFHWIQRIYEDRKGILWLCTNGGPVSFNRKTGQFKPYPVFPSEARNSPSHSISSILEDNSGVLWVGSWGGGYLTYNALADSFESHSLGWAMPSNPNSFCQLYKDRAGTIWFGTNGDGVLKTTREKSPFVWFLHNLIRSVPPSGASLPKSPSLQSNDIRFIYADPPGFVSVGTAAGNEKFFPGERMFQSWGPSPGHYSSTGLVHSRVGGNLWSAGGFERAPTGLLRGTESPNQWMAVASTEKAGLGVAYSLFEDRRGILWMLCADAGLCQFDPRTGKLKSLRIGQRQPFSAARMIIEDSIDVTDDGWALWIGTQDGLWRYEAKSDSFTRFGHDPRDPATLSSNSITTIFRDARQDLWVATDRGLDRMDHAFRTFEHYTTNDGLPDNAVQGILEDRHGYLWVSTTNTISRLDPRNRRFVPHIVESLIPGTRFAAGCCLYVEPHEMYFGGNGGFVVFDPDSVQENMYVPPIVITGLSTFDTAVPLDTVIEEKKAVEFSYKENLFTIEFAALNFIHPERNQYAYMLEGYDTEWKYCGDRQFARYMNVSPGSYTFRVKGSNNDGVWNETGTWLVITITPPWWKTTWASILLWFGVVGMMAGGVRFYDRRKSGQRIAELERQRALERERTRISQDMHDEVGSSLSEIAILSELAKKKPDQAVKRIEEISDRTAELIDNVSEIVWAMNPRNDTLDNLVAHARRYAVQYLNLAGIPCRVSTPETVPSSPLSSELRRSIFLVVKESLHNIVKHAAASAVAVDVQTDKSTLVLRIQDNGRGFVPGQETEAGNGLASMRRRAADIGATIDIQSQPGYGTTVELTVKM